MDPMLIWGLTLIAVSVLLLVVELFVPSGGVIAVTAGVVGIAGVTCLFLMDQHGVLWGTAGILTLVVLFPSAFFAWTKLLPSTRMGRALIGEVPEEDRRLRDETELSERARFRALIGQEGLALTDLRPIGLIELDGQRFDALAEGVAVERGDRIRVTDFQSNQLRVRPV